MICMVNPSERDETVELPELYGAVEQLIIGGIRVQEDKEKKQTKVLLEGGSFVILKKDGGEWHESTRDHTTKVHG